MVAGVTWAATVGPLIGLVVWMVARAAASGRITRNGVIGIRTRATQASDEAWQAAHAATVRPAFTYFLALLPGSITAWLQPGNEQVQVACSIVIAALIVADSLTVIVVSTRAASAVT